MKDISTEWQYGKRKEIAFEAPSPQPSPRGRGSELLPVWFSGWFASINFTALAEYSSDFHFACIL
jgi:hypothetical protein